ncbi:protein IMPAIRED IN BABA-INDUCED STERILITY 1-like isoform X2 [Phoenix dactylifera]|uniref:[RNA-polymerase]-subunit kinase n=1 Tax=Phoenix dactylifera TaxID=42345 RepID=A0A8B7BLR6_PHODC|nr:protein IMPAIRED IN BABA-INDUCED STERILITY 1-like isoform X2 [Phoenix dactylifera]
MGCVASKNAAAVTPVVDLAGVSGSLEASSSLFNRPKLGSYEFGDRSESGESGKIGSASNSMIFRLGNLHRCIEGEQAAAGWPAWLTAVAGEAIQGWVPLKAESFERMDKIGQGTYSSVFRARELDTGKIVALKRVRFDVYEPESVRFMAREIQILRRLDHPNIAKLEGLITSRLSSSIYLVFDYMEHDLAGLLSAPDINFSEPQIKCYMRQLLSGLEHCHSRGIMHRDIKCANLLINNEGILKIADFGLANFFSAGQIQPLTSRVVTLWYRPPELLLGSTDYEASVDLWSVGCVFAEVFLRKPIFQGRTEVEQIHKIFKLCGSPPEEFWKKSKLPHATLFKPQQPYGSCLRETLKRLPENAFNLLETFLSVEPYRRGTASTALASEYFKSKPYACAPSSSPKYPPNKEIDAKAREDVLRRRVHCRPCGIEATRKPLRTYRTSQESNGLSRAASLQKDSWKTTGGSSSGAKRDPRENGDTRMLIDLQPVPETNSNPPDKGRYVKQTCQKDVLPSGPLQVPASSGFAWAKKPKEDRSYTKSRSRSNSRSHASRALDHSNIPHMKNPSNPKGQADRLVGHAPRSKSNNCKPYEIAKDKMLAQRSQPEISDRYEIANHAIMNQWTNPGEPDLLDSCDSYHSRDLSDALYKRDAKSTKCSILDYKDQRQSVELSGPLLSQSLKIDELLEKNEGHIGQAARRSWFQKGTKQGH